VWGLLLVGMSCLFRLTLPFIELLDVVVLVGMGQIEGLFWLTGPLVEHVMVGILSVGGLFWLVLPSAELVAVEMLRGVGQICGLC
jgi:hypothetical protein